MDTPERSNTAGNSEKRVPGDPFKKGDPRINRKGRPRVADELRELTLEVLHEKATTKDGAPVVIDGHVVTNIELMIRQMIRNPKMFELVLNRAFGKLPQPLEHSGADGERDIPIVIKINGTISD